MKRLVAAACTLVCCGAQSLMAQNFYPELPALTGNERIQLAYPNTLGPFYTDPNQIATYVGSIAASVPGAAGSIQISNGSLGFGTPIVPAAGIATWLATPSSANFLAALTTKTGTGSAVFGTGPTVTGLIHGDITGSTQCLHVNTAGLVTGTGSDCGSGGGGTPAGSTGDFQINTGGNFAAVTPGTGITTWFSTPTSANLAAAMTNETGSGSLVFATSPTLVTPVLGTVAAGSVLTNATGLPISTGVSGLGTGVATWAATPTSANLRAAMTDETGTGGGLVFATSPTVSGLIHGDITGSTQCLHVNTSGLVTGTGSDCGAGGGVPGGSSGQLQYNNTGAFGGATVGTGLDMTAGALTLTIVPNNQTGATYTLLTTDANKSVNMTNASPTTVTVLAAATAGANYGTYAYCKAGCTLARSGSDTINGATSLVLSANQAVSLSSDGTSAWTAAILAALDPTNGANLQAASVANSKLTNSTISGIALGSNLAALTATDTTLTLSGSYSGATARTVGLNLGNANTWTAGQATTPVAGGSVTGTVTPDANAGNDWTYTLGGNITLANPSNPRAGQSLNFVLTQDGTGSRLVSTWGSSYKFSGGTKPTLSTTAGAVDMITCRTITTTYIVCGSILNPS